MRFGRYQNVKITRLEMEPGFCVNYDFDPRSIPQEVMARALEEIAENLKQENPGEAFNLAEAEISADGWTVVPHNSPNEVETMLCIMAKFPDGRGSISIMDNAFNRDERAANITTTVNALRQKITATFAVAEAIAHKAA